MINISIDTTTVEGIKRELINQLKSKINQAHRNGLPRAIRHQFNRRL